MDSGLIGLSRKTGQILTGWELFVELAEDALTTQLGSRQKRRDYGSRLPELLGRITGEDVLMKAQIYATEAFIHPPNNLAHLFTVSRIIASRHAGGLRLQIAGSYGGQAVTFEVPINATG